MRMQAPLALFFCQNESQERQTSENVLENMTSASPSASYPTIEESENGLFLGKSNTGPHVGGFQEHEAEEHESLEPPVLSCKTQTINDLSPSIPVPLPKGIPGTPLSSTFLVRTPAKNERRQSTKKIKSKYYNKKDYLPTEREEKRRRRRLMFPMIDEVLILSNKLLVTQECNRCHPQVVEQFVDAGGEVHGARPHCLVCEHHT